MRVYYFTCKKYGLENLTKKRLKVARIDNLNDPFEFMAVDLSDCDFRLGVEEMKRSLSKDYGILCFSKNWDNPVQWTHYADRHKGLCLGFDVPDEHLDKIKYYDNRQSAKEFQADLDTRSYKFESEMDDYVSQGTTREEIETRRSEFLELAQQRLREESKIDVQGLAFIQDVIFTKYSHWSYENEYRFCLPLNEKIDGLYHFNGLIFCEFSDNLKLKEVIVGSYSHVTRAIVERSLGDMASSVQIFKVREDYREYAMVRDENYRF